MADVSLRTLLDGVKSTLGTANGMVRAEALEDITDGVSDLPILKIFFWSANADANSQTDRSSFGGGVKLTQVVVNADLFATEQSHMGEDDGGVVDGFDAVVAILQAQNAKPYFGVDGLKGFRWEAQRAEIGWGNEKYSGIRFTLTFTIF